MKYKIGQKVRILECFYDDPNHANHVAKFVREGKSIDKKIHIFLVHLKSGVCTASKIELVKETRGRPKKDKGTDIDVGAKQPKTLETLEVGDMVIRKDGEIMTIYGTFKDRYWVDFNKDGLPELTYDSDEFKRYDWSPYNPSEKTVMFDGKRYPLDDLKKAVDEAENEKD